MDFGISEEQQQLKNSAREFLTGECPTTFVRKVMASEDGAAAELYAQIAKLGWQGLIVPEKFGGAGLAMLDMAMLLEEQGYAAMPGPFLFSSVLAASALKEFGTDELQKKWLPALAEGKAIGTLAIAEEDDGIEPASISTRCRNEGGELVINGRKMFVPYANVADFIIVAVRTGDAPNEVTFVTIDSKAPGVTVKMLKSLDLTRRVCSVELKDVRVKSSAQLNGGRGSGRFAWRYRTRARNGGRIFQSPRAVRQAHWIVPGAQACRGGNRRGPRARAIAAMVCRLCARRRTESGPARGGDGEGAPLRSLQPRHGSRGPDAWWHRLHLGA
jgi:hypothetical protein